MIIIAAAAKSLQSCPTLCDPIEDSPPGSYSPLISGRLRRHMRAGVCDGARGRASATAHEGGRLSRRTRAGVCDGALARPRGATPSLRSGAEARRTPCPRVGGQEELPHI